MVQHCDSSLSVSASRCSRSRRISQRIASQLFSAAEMALCSEGELALVLTHRGLHGFRSVASGHGGAFASGSVFAPICGVNRSEDGVRGEEGVFASVLSVTRARGVFSGSAAMGT